MGITERREREREKVRRKILDAARELFENEGYDKVTMRRIAEAIEYSPTTIYLHFEDKDDLVRALCNEDFARLLEALSLIPPAADPIDPPPCGPSATRPSPACSRRCRSSRRPPTRSSRSGSSGARTSASRSTTRTTS